jgi:predicted porin
MKITRFTVALAATVAISQPAFADVPIVKIDNWELFTNGRINAFFSYGWGDSNPVPLVAGENITPGGGLNTSYDNIPVIGPSGMALPVQGTFKSMRMRSGFVPNVLGFGLKRALDESTTLKIYASFWGTIETESQRKTAPNYAAFQEGYLKVEAPWGTATAGRQLSLFSRGATETEFMYGHGYALGYPGNIDTFGPTAGLIGFGVLAAFFSPGVVYATPKMAGLQMNVGLFDPTPFPGGWEGTRYARPEAELTYDFQRGGFKVHLFGNGAYQPVYKPGSDRVETVYGTGYGGRFEMGPVHLGASAHYGRGLGLAYAIQPGPITIGPSPDNDLRKFDGYSVLGQFVAGQFDFNLGWGMSRAYQLQSDRDSRLTASPISLLKNQQAIAAVVVYHATDNIHLSIDYLHGQAKWFLGEEQKFDFVNTGAVATW